MKKKKNVRKIGKQNADIAQRTRKEVLSAALQVFAEVGYEAATLREIANRVGIAHGLIRHHFGSKEEVWCAIVDQAVDRYAEALTPYTATSPDSKADYLASIKSAIRGAISVSSQHPEVIRLLIYEGIKGGERLEYMLNKFASLGEMMATPFKSVQALGYLRQFNDSTFFLFLLTAGFSPFALSPLSNSLIANDLFSAKQVKLHEERIISTLFGTN